jgi:hypothetical protein
MMLYGSLANSWIDITSDLKSKAKLQQRLNNLMATSGFSVLQNTDGYARYEVLNYLKKETFEHIINFTFSYIQSVPLNASFADFLTPMIIYKKYADHVSSLQKSLGVFGRVFYTDTVSDTYKKVVEALFKKMEDMKPGMLILNKLFVILLTNWYR